MKNTVTILLILLLLILAGCSQSGNTVSGETEKLLESMVEAFNSGDIETLDNLYSDDIESEMPFTKRLEGKELVIARDETLMSLGWKIEIKKTKISNNIVTGELSVKPGTMDWVTVELEFISERQKIKKIITIVDLDKWLEALGPPSDLPEEMVPLTDMSDGQQYRGEDGGLYSNYQNNPPQVHLLSAEEVLSTIEPLDSKGNPSCEGKILFVSIGMSNTEQYFDAFLKLSSQDTRKSVYVACLNGAQGGSDSDAHAWAVGPSPWLRLEKKITEAGFTRDQIQIAWLLHAQILGAGHTGDFLQNQADSLKDDLLFIITRLKEDYPNLKIIYISSLPYCGYATTSLGSGGYGYESAFVARWLILDQINGDPNLNYNPNIGSVKSPLLLWGPYLWAHGTTSRSDGLVWKREDFDVDGVHPSDIGAEKVAGLLLDFLKTNELASTWYLGPPYANSSGSEPKPLEPSSEGQDYEEPRPIDEEPGEPIKTEPQPK